MNYKFILILTCSLLACVTFSASVNLDCKIKRSSSYNDKPTGVSCNFTSNLFNEAKSDLIHPQTATPMKNILKGPADLGIYYVNSPGLSCGGLKAGQCSTSCGALGYPVYWCYPKVCYCHYGAQETNEIEDDIVLPSASN